MHLGIIKRQILALQQHQINYQDHDNLMASRINHEPLFRAQGSIYKEITFDTKSIVCTRFLISSFNCIKN